MWAAQRNRAWAARTTATKNTYTHTKMQFNFSCRIIQYTVRGRANSANPTNKIMPASSSERTCKSLSMYACVCVWFCVYVCWGAGAANHPLRDSRAGAREFCCVRTRSAPRRLAHAAHAWADRFVWSYRGRDTQRPPAWESVGIVHGSVLRVHASVNRTQETSACSVEQKKQKRVCVCTCELPAWHPQVVAAHRRVKVDAEFKHFVWSSCSWQYQKSTISCRKEQLIYMSYFLIFCLTFTLHL